MKKLILAGVAAVAATACSTTAPTASGAEQHYYARPTGAAGSAHPWVVILPGGGGIEVFGDTEFYFDVAKWWNEAGYDALVVHYQAAAPMVAGADDPAPGPMEAAVVADALAAARRNGWLDFQCPGFVTGFSMGGAGTLALAANPPANLAGAIGYYPLVAGMPAGFDAKVPLLILQGEQDQLTTPAALDSFLGTANPARIKVVRYPGAHHGFDIPSLAEPVEFNGGTFHYHRASQEAATAEAAAFRKQVFAAHPASVNCSAE